MYLSRITSWTHYVQRFCSRCEYNKIDFWLKNVDTNVRPASGPLWGYNSQSYPPQYEGGGTLGPSSDKLTLPLSGADIGLSIVNGRIIFGDELELGDDKSPWLAVLFLEVGEKATFVSIVRLLSLGISTTDCRVTVASPYSNSVDLMKRVDSMPITRTSPHLPIFPFK